MSGKLDPRNTLNDLTGKEWLLRTRSFWKSEKCAEDKFAYSHPAPFLVKDIEKLVTMFTKKGMRVLDPFSGIGTTLVACRNTGRKGIGVELNPEYVELTTERIKGQSKGQKIILGDALEKVRSIRGRIDYCVTSPPYHNILRNNSKGLREKKSKDFRIGSRIGVTYYSEDPRDLGNQTSFAEFLSLFSKVMEDVFKKLNDGKYTSVIISDFTVDKKERNVVGEIISAMTKIGFEFSGTTALLQDHKPLYPFGYPYAYKINHQHQSIITFRKVAERP